MLTILHLVWNPRERKKRMKRIFVWGDPELQKNYREALEFSGAIPVFSTELERALECDGLLLSGGGDMDPARYGEINTGESRNIDPARDEAELALISRFSEAGLPVLGICRGCQVINAAFGGSLVQHLPTAQLHQYREETGDQVHPIKAFREGFLFPLYGECFPVNSSHHQAVKQLAPGFRCAAAAGDGTIEAIENPEKKIYGVQFHPERMSFHQKREDTADGKGIFEFFLSLC